jgi:putative drug exporter of the RND superfamily
VVARDDPEDVMLEQALTRLGGGAARRPWPVVVTWLLIAVVALGAAARLGGRTTDSLTVPGLDSQRAAELLQVAGSDRGGMTAQVVATPKDATTTFFTSAPARQALARLQSDLAALPRVRGVGDPARALTEGREGAVGSGTVSPDGRVALLRVQYPDRDELSVADLRALVAVGHRQPASSPVRLEMGGELFWAFSTTGSIGEVAGLLVAAAILFLTFGSMVAAAIPIGMAVIGLAVGVSVIGLLAAVTEIPTFATVLGSMIGLGVGIDYALFVLTRHREYLARGLDVPTAAGRAVGSTGPPVVFAGGTVIVSILGLAVAGVPFMTAGGLAVALVVLVMVIASLTLLPAYLGLAGRRIHSRRVASNPDGAAPDASTGWSRWVSHVGRHPAAYAIGASALLLVAAVPVLALRVGIPDDGALPPDRTERRAYDLVAAGFGPGANGPIVVVARTGADPEVLDRLTRALLRDRGVAGVSVAPVDPTSGIAALTVQPTSGPQDAETARTVARLRTEVLPVVVGLRPAEPLQAHVGGSAAAFADVGQRVDDRLPVFVGAVLALSFLLLMLVFRSVVVPLKAVLLNLLSIAAAYGVMVAVFQWGWGASLIGLHESVPVVSFIPMFMFAVLFGLSMDYEVFLLSRVREEYRRTGDNADAVVRGIAGTARVIGSAALIMVSVFLAFVFGPDPATKMFGVGLATAVLLDATLVRLVLVPATMTLLGRANWWLPGPLDRLLPGRPTAPVAPETASP